jgi:hypothetical protein
MERSLTDAQIELYSRQILLREVGGIGQKKLLGAAVLLVGEGPALDVIASYLAGAGVGDLDLLSGPGGARSEAATGPRGSLAPLAERNPDVRLRELASPPPRLDEYDVAVIEGRTAPLLAEIPGAPRLGAVRVAIRADGGIEIVLLPAGTRGCVLCAQTEPDANEAASRATAGGADEELAGALAALAICRWIATSPGDDETQGLHLAPGAPTWEPVQIAFAAACARGCRS